MSQPAKAQEPSMEEILASIRRIIADDETAKPAAAKPAPRRPRRAAARGHAAAQSGAAAPAPPQPAAAMEQHDIDAMLAGLDAPPGGAAPQRKTFST